MMDGQLGSDGDSGVGTRGGRIDWRTGKRMVARDEAFWQGLEIRRCEQGLSIPQYCRANGLALSAFPYRVGRLALGEGGVGTGANESRSRAISAWSTVRGGCGHDEDWRQARGLRRRPKPIWPLVQLRPCDDAICPERPLSGTFEKGPLLADTTLPASVP